MKIVFSISKIRNLPIAVIEAESRLDIVNKQCIYSSGLSSRTVGTWTVTRFSAIIRKKIIILIEKKKEKKERNKKIIVQI